MSGERFYVASDNGNLLVIGWNLNHEPNAENECGYGIEAGPFLLESEAKDYIGQAA